MGFIKSFLIMVLAVALLVAGVMTRPSEQSARAFLAGGEQPVAAAPRPLADVLKDAVIKSADGPAVLPTGYVFKDRVLWVEVQKDGQTVYTGVLAHWFKQDPPVQPLRARDETTVAIIQPARGR
jgi:hypothetical protein